MSKVNRSAQTPDVIAPNSFLAQLIETSPDSAFRTLSRTSIVTALGLLALLDPKKPAREIIVPPKRILEILDTALDVEEVLSGKGPRKYSGKRYKTLHKALLSLHSTEITLTLTTNKTRKKRGLEKSILHTHFLDSFRYIFYDKSGEEKNLDLLPESQKKNVSTSKDRAVYRLENSRPSKIGFRLNSEFAAELKRRGGRTIFYARIFGLLRALLDSPSSIRVALWIIGNRDLAIKTNRFWLFQHLVTSAGHRTKKEENTQLEKALKRLQDLHVIVEIESKPYKNREGSYLVIHKSPEWHVGRASEEGK